MIERYGLSPRQLKRVVVDCDMTVAEAFGDDKVPVEHRDLHDQMRRYLRLMRVIHKGYDDLPHSGLILVHYQLADAVERSFVGMFRAGFPIESVIPMSYFDYDDERSMQANNTSCYRPDRLKSGVVSEHFKGLAVDINPLNNPMDIINDDGQREIHPAGASYDPHAKGAITPDSEVRFMWRGEDFEWGGGWGDPNDPDIFQAGFFDYQHFEPFEHLLSGFDLPSGM